MSDEPIADVIRRNQATVWVVVDEWMRTPLGRFWSEWLVVTDAQREVALANLAGVSDV